MTDYYLAQKGCSLGIYKRVILAVKNNKVIFHRGHVDDKFEIDSEGKLSCTTERGGLEYSICSLNDEELSKVIDEGCFGDFTKKTRSHSYRGL